MIKTYYIAILLIVLASCKKKELPVLGRTTITGTDTLVHKIPDFTFVNQDSVLISNNTFANSIYIADFFFTSCPTICPVMKKQMLRVYEKYLDNDKVKILSHTIDPAYDNVERLSEYAKALGVSSYKWHFVTGNKDEIYEIGEKSYMVTAGKDKDAPGGFIHGGAFLLIDNDRKIRGVYDGTEPGQVTLLISDIGILLDELKLDE